MQEKIKSEDEPTIADPVRATVEIQQRNRGVADGARTTSAPWTVKNKKTSNQYSPPHPPTKRTTQRKPYTHKEPEAQTLHIQTLHTQRRSNKNNSVLYPSPATSCNKTRRKPLSAYTVLSDSVKLSTLAVRHPPPRCFPHSCATTQLKKEVKLMQKPRTSYSLKWENGWIMRVHTPQLKSHGVDSVCTYKKSEHSKEGKKSHFSKPKI